MDRWSVGSRRNILRLLTLFIVVLVALSACTTQASSSNVSGPPIKIGISLSSSGQFAEDGQASEQGYQLWADMVNQNGGLLGRPVQLVILHDDSTQSKVVANYKQLITVDHVNLVFGPFSTLLTLAAAPVAAKYGYALVEGSGGGPSVFTQGFTNVFDVSLPVDENLISFALYVLSLPKAIRPTTVAYATEDDPFTQPQIDKIVPLLTQGGVTPVYYDVYSSDTKNFTPIADKIIQSGAQIVIVGTFLPDIAAFIQRFRQANYNPKMIIATAGPDQGEAFVKAIGGEKYTQGVMVPNGWYPQVDNFQNAQMVQAYLAKYGGTADNINADVAEAFSVGQVVAQAITKTQSLDNAKLIRELHSDIFNSVQGSVQFDSTGQNTLALAYLFQWQNGSLIPVYPDSIAVANPRFRPVTWQSGSLVPVCGGMANVPCGASL
jgi:branched-chain amino acid transport system substrate-binding protein